MRKHAILGYILAGAAAGTVAGIFGAGGGMVLVPLLTLLTDTSEEALFPTSLSIMLPICVVTVLIAAMQISIPWKQAIPYLTGSAVGGILAGRYGARIPVKWLHRSLGILILWGGIRYLC